MVGIKPIGKVNLRWTANLAYAVGLLATDGSLSKDGRHIDLTSKDEDQLNNFLKCLNLKNKIGSKTSGLSKKKQLRVQFGDVLFYRFLVNLGLTLAKSKTLGALKIPKKYFLDFLRGEFDGDGSFYSYWDKRWKSSFMFYLTFSSASKKHVDWLRIELREMLKVNGHVTHDIKGGMYQLKYAKQESQKVIKKMYRGRDAVYLKRKKLKIDKALSTISQ